MWFWLAVLAWVAVIGLFAFNRTLVRSPAKRFMVYLFGVPLVALIVGTFVIRLESCDSSEGECDLAGLAAVSVGAFALVVGFGAAIVFEGVRWFLAASDRYERR